MVRRRRCGPFLARDCRRRLSMRSDRESTSGGYFACGPKKLVQVNDESSMIFSAADQKKNPGGVPAPGFCSLHFRLASGGDTGQEVRPYSLVLDPDNTAKINAKTDERPGDESAH